MRSERPAGDDAGRTAARSVYDHGWTAPCHSYAMGGVLPVGVHAPTHPKPSLPDVEVEVEEEADGGDGTMWMQQWKRLRREEEPQDPGQPAH